MVILQGEEEQMMDSKELKVQSKNMNTFVLREDTDVVDDKTVINGQGWYFPS